MAKGTHFLEKAGICGLQRIGADQMTLCLRFIDFRAQCCDVFYFSDFERIGLNFRFDPVGPGYTCALFCRVTQMFPQEATDEKFIRLQCHQ